MVSLEQLQELDPYDFEKAIASLWEAKGFETNLRQQSGDRGVDIEAEKVGAGWKEVIQAKRYTGKNKVGSQQIREYATLYQQVPDANAVVVVTSGEFTDEAESLADDLRVETYDGRELVREISDTGVDLNLAPEENGSQSDTLQLGSSDPEIDSYGSVELGGGTIVEPQDYFRDHLKKRSGSAGLKSQPWVYVATEVDGLDLELAWDLGLTNPHVNFGVSQNGVEYLDDNHRLTRVPFELVSDAEYQSYIMGLRKPTKLTFTLRDGSEHVVTLQRGYKKRNVKYMVKYVRSRS